jgi:uncharacterized protein with PhoU and TrkA domain
MRLDHAKDAPFSFAAGTAQGEDSSHPARCCTILHATGAFSKETAMQLKLRSPELALQAGQVLTLDDAEGMRILARRGTVWITEEGNNKDHIVGPGDTIVVGRSGRTVVQALQPAWISIQGAPKAANDAFARRPVEG